MQSSVIRDFLGLEDQVGTWEATWVLGEELEMHHIELNHNVLGCQDWQSLIFIVPEVDIIWTTLYIFVLGGGVVVA